jgi:hypothetical protein
MSPQVAAKLFASLVAFVVAFQLALALGAPWGQFAMGGAFPGRLPAALRIAALVQIGVLAATAAIILSRAGLAAPRLRPASRWLAWIVAGLTGVAAVLNLVTPSAGERLVWAPVALTLFATALRVALSA